MRLSVWPDASRPFEDLVAVVTHAEKLGYHSAYVADHFMANSDAGVPDDRPPSPAATTDSRVPGATRCRSAMSR